MSYAYTPIMVSMASPVSEILLLLNLAKFPFKTMHGSQKIELIGISSKNSCKERLMLYAYTPILVTVEKQNNYNFSLVMHYSLSDKGMVLIPCVCEGGASNISFSIKNFPNIYSHPKSQCHKKNNSAFY